MRRWGASAVADGGLLAFDDGIGDRTDFFGKPKPRLACCFVIGFTEHLHTIVTTERIDLAERFHVALGVNGERAATVVIENALSIAEKLRHSGHTRRARAQQAST